MLQAKDLGYHHQAAILYAIAINQVSSTAISNPAPSTHAAVNATGAVTVGVVQEKVTTEPYIFSSVSL